MRRSFQGIVHCFPCLLISAVPLYLVLVFSISTNIALCHAGRAFGRNFTQRRCCSRDVRGMPWETAWTLWILNFRSSVQGLQRMLAEVVMSTERLDAPSRANVTMTGSTCKMVVGLAGGLSVERCWMCSDSNEQVLWPVYLQPGGL